MNPAIAAIAAAPGLALGSFLNVVATRLPEKAAIGTSRSACAHCEAPIRWFDNVPVLS
ncbi:MAG: prepilin peptidase, partial [Gaiella sp.]